MKRPFLWLALVIACAAAPAAQATLRSDLIREILRRKPEWPNVQVEIPADVYEEYVRALSAKPVPPEPPEAAWIERATYRVAVTGEEATLGADFDIVVLLGKEAKALPLLHDALAWNETTLDGEPFELRHGDDGWFYLDPPEPGRYRVAAQAPLKARLTGDIHAADWATPPAAWTVGAVESNGVWEVRFSRSPLPIVGDREVNGTQGSVGLVPGDRLTVTWRPPQPPVRRKAQIVSESHVGWTLAEGVHQVRAILDLRLWGGEAEELTLMLPPRADRVEVTGPDVREVQTLGDGVRVFLRGAIRQRTRLAVSFESPRPATGRVSLPAFGVAGARNGGGTLAIAGGGEAVILELESPGLEPMALADLPDQTRGLLAAPPVYAYRLRPDFWEARIDLVAMAEFPVRETLIDSALYTVLYRPDGRVMTKVIYEVRNRTQQYMKVDLPPRARLVVARVSEQQTNLARGPGSSIYVPLEKSVLTTAGLISFPVELVYVTPAEPLSRKGAFRLLLPRADLPIAYARCAVMLPKGMRLDEWRGVLREVETWSSETAELEFEYGRGHLAPAPAEEPPKPKRPGLLGAIGGLFMMGAQAPEQPDTAALDRKRQWELQTLTGQVKNRYRAAVDYYHQGNYEKARELFQQTIRIAPDSTEGYNAKKYLENVDIALGERKEGARVDRGSQAAAKAVQRAQQMSNVAMLERQQKLLGHGRVAAQKGDEKQAEAAYQVAVQLGADLQKRGEEKREQDAIVREAQKYLRDASERRKKTAEEVGKLRGRLEQLKQSISEVGGKEAEGLAEILVLDERAAKVGGFTASGRVPDFTGAAPRFEPQIERGTALAEQWVAFAGKVGGAAGRAFEASWEQAPEEQVTELKHQVERLEKLQERLAGEKVAEGEPVPAAVLAADEDADVERKVVERAKALKAQARQAAGLARAGRVAEAERLMQKVGKDVEATARAAASLEKARLPEEPTQVTGALPGLPTARPVEKPDAILSDIQAVQDVGRLEVRADVRDRLALAERRMRRAATPDELNAAFQPIAQADRLLDAAGALEADETKRLRDEIGALRSEIGRRQKEVAKAPGAPDLAGTAPGDSRGRRVDQLWGRARGFQQQKKFHDAVTVLDDILALEPENKRARLWKEDLSRLASRGRPTAEPVAPPAPSAIQRPESRASKELVEFKSEYFKAVEALEEEKGRRETVELNVEDITDKEANGRELADFIAHNYSWALRPDDSGTTVVTGGDGGYGAAAGAEPEVVFSDGNLRIANDPVVVGQVQAVLDRLRANVGQRVRVGSRNIFIGSQTARAAGIDWVEGAGGVRYAVVNEGQLLGLLDIEQRDAAAPPPSIPRELGQDAVVGTQALLANSGVLDVTRAGDDANKLSYNDNDIQVAHEDYLLVDNGSYLTAVKSGRMLHWSAEVEEVRFPGVPAAVVVPAVGYTVKFEKRLLDPEDPVELATQYTWEGEER